MVQCSLTDKVSDIIDKYRKKANSHNENALFIFNAKNLNKNLTVQEAGLVDNANVFVVEKK